MCRPSGRIADPLEVNDASARADATKSELCVLAYTVASAAAVWVGQLDRFTLLFEVLMLAQQMPFAAVHASSICRGTGCTPSARAI